jgi:glucose/arabinose dehydrogenase
MDCKYTRGQHHGKIQILPNLGKAFAVYPFKTNTMKLKFSGMMLISAFVAISFISCKKSKNQNNPPDNWPTDSIRTVVQGLNFPWEILWGPDDHIWMTERPGKISSIDPKTGDILFSATIPDVVSNGEGGLLGMALHPDFMQNGYIYVSYNYSASGGYREKIMRFKYSNLSLKEPLTLIENIPASSIHNGSRVRIIDDGTGLKLYFTSGDASVSSNAQDQNSRSGKVMRLNLDGSVPSDNPVAGNPMWTFGHRNPQGLIFANGFIYTAEHGPDIEDEVNIIEKGRNYGWPNVNGPCDGGELSFCNTNNVKEPIWSSGSSTIATSGIDYYDKDLITGWKNSILVATLKDESLRQLKLSDDHKSVIQANTYFKNQFGRLRDICISPAGRVYLCTSNGGDADKLIEISRLN